MIYWRKDKTTRRVFWPKVMVPEPLYSVVSNEYQMLKEWCNEFPSDGKYYYHHNTNVWWFEKKEDAAMFALRWL